MNASPLPSVVPVVEKSPMASSVGFVPTMGALHEGHLALVRRARAQCARVVVSVFVNPTQFEPTEDFEQYPRDVARDLALLKREGVDEIWVPSVSEIYPNGLDDVRWVKPPASLTQILCGVDRPRHFVGVATVLKRLFEHVQPTDAYFGQKDYQQTRVVHWLVRSFFPQMRLHVEETVREEDGLALSSRNVFLSSEEREWARVLPNALRRLKEAFDSGERDLLRLNEVLRVALIHPKIEVRYAELRDAETLQLVENMERPVVALVAVRIGKTRLIDNVLLHASR